MRPIKNYVPSTLVQIKISNPRKNFREEWRGGIIQKNIRVQNYGTTDHYMLLVKVVVTSKDDAGEFRDKVALRSIINPLNVRPFPSRYKRKYLEDNKNLPVIQ